MIPRGDLPTMGLVVVLCNAGGMDADIATALDIITNIEKYI
jgi:hypothetical protein